MAKYELNEQQLPQEPRGRPTRINREKIIEAAMKLPSQQLSMTSVAAALGVKPPTLYYHIQSIDELRSLMVEKITWDLRVPVADTWQQWCKGFAYEFRGWLIAEPIRLQLVEMVGPVAGAATDFITQCLESLAKLGFPQKIVVQSFFLLAQAVQDFVSREYEYYRQPANFAKVIEQMQQFTIPSNADKSAYNLLVTQMQQLDFEKFFEFQIAIIIAGLADYIKDNKEQ